MTIKERLSAIREKIALAEERSGRAKGSVDLMAVSKFHGRDEVLEALECGQTLYGENRVQEAIEKFSTIPQFRERGTLHLIGSLQRNKVKNILPHVDCIQSIDRIELLEEILKHASAGKSMPDLLFEYHTGEESKAGFSNTDSLWRSIDLLMESPFSTHCKGLMTMAPFTKDVNVIAFSFRTLANVRLECQKRYPDLDFSVLSMGMSNDYEIAIEEGSTLVRIGTAIFGERA